MFVEKNRTPKAYPGQSLLELTLVLPFLLFVLFGVLDLGRVFFSTVTLVSAAREGARYLAVYPGDAGSTFGPFMGTIETVKQEAANSGLILNNGEIDPNCTNLDENPEFCDSGGTAIVIVTHDFDLVLGWFLPSPVTIERSAQMVVP